MITRGPILERVLSAEIADGSRPFRRAGVTLGRVLGSEIAVGRRLFPSVVAILGRVLGAKIADGSRPDWDPWGKDRVATDAKRRRKGC